MSQVPTRRAPTLGEATVENVLLLNNNLTLTSGVLFLGYFPARRTESISKVIVPVSGTAAAATPTLIRYGVYSVAASGAVALIASTPNDTTLLAATFNETTSGPAKSLSVPFQKQAGLWYAVGVLVVTGAAAPTIPACVTVASPSFAPLNNRPRQAGKLTAQSDLPSTVAAGSIAASGAIPFAYLAP